MTDRAQVWLQPPAARLDLSDYPTRPLPARVIRAHHPDRSPWWFASVERADQPGGGRFDLTAPRGTLYASNDVEAAVRERLGDPLGLAPMIDPSTLATTTVSVLSPKLAIRPRLADVRDGTGVLTREISTVADYALTRAWASAFRAAGFTALAYEPRSTMPAKVRAYALLGDAGEVTHPFSAHRTWRTILRQRGVLATTIAGRFATIIP